MKPILFCLLISPFLASCTGELNDVMQKQQKLKEILKKNSSCNEVRSVTYSITNGMDSAYAEFAGCTPKSPKAEAEHLNAAVLRTLSDGQKLERLTLSFVEKRVRETFRYSEGKLTGSERTETVID